MNYINKIQQTFYSFENAIKSSIHYDDLEICITNLFLKALSYLEYLYRITPHQIHSFTNGVRSILRLPIQLNDIQTTIEKAKERKNHLLHISNLMQTSAQENDEWDDNAIDFNIIIKDLENCANYDIPSIIRLKWKLQQSLSYFETFVKDRCPHSIFSLRNALIQIKQEDTTTESTLDVSLPTSLDEQMALIETLDAELQQLEKNKSIEKKLEIISDTLMAVCGDTIIPFRNSLPLYNLTKEIRITRFFLAYNKHFSCIFFALSELRRSYKQNLCSNSHQMVRLEKLNEQLNEKCEEWNIIVAKLKETFKETKLITEINDSLDRCSALKILGLTECATEEEIHNTYKHLVLVNHPDKGGNNYAFIPIQKAYKYLQDHPETFLDKLRRVFTKTTATSNPRVESSTLRLT